MTALIRKLSRLPPGDLAGICFITTIVGMVGLGMVTSVLVSAAAAQIAVGLWILAVPSFMGYVALQKDDKQGQ